MTIQGHIDYDWLTTSRARVLRELADDRTEREAAERLGITYNGLRSLVEDIKDETGLRSVREISRWWRQERVNWLAWWAEQGGVNEKGYQE